MKNYYQILEVNENASPEVIEKAYRVLAKKYHPDTYPKDKVYWAESKFKEITEAYTILSDENARKNYDIKIGLNSSSGQKYDKLYYQYEKLEQEVNILKTNTESQKNLNKAKENRSYFKRYISSIGDLIYKETKKSPEERSKDLKALILTIIIVTVIIFVFIKVPFLNKLIFP